MSLLDLILVLFCRGCALTDSRHLPRLLDYELLLAASVQDRQPAVSYDCAAFIVGLTKGVPNALDLFVQASAFAAVKGRSSNLR